MILIRLFNHIAHNVTSFDGSYVYAGVFLGGNVSMIIKTVVMHDVNEK